LQVKNILYTYLLILRDLVCRSGYSIYMNSFRLREAEKVLRVATRYVCPESRAPILWV